MQLLAKPSDEIMIVTRNLPNGELVTEEFNFLWASFGVSGQGHGAVAGEVVAMEPVTAAGEIKNAAERKSVLPSSRFSQPYFVAETCLESMCSAHLFFLRVFSYITRLFTLSRYITVEGKIAVVMRGDISFVDKALKAQKANATALIIVNNEDTLLTPGVCLSHTHLLSHTHVSVCVCVCAQVRMYACTCACMCKKRMQLP